MKAEWLEIISPRKRPPERAIMDYR